MSLTYCIRVEVTLTHELLCLKCQLKYTLLGSHLKIIFELFTLIITYRKIIYQYDLFYIFIYIFIYFHYMVDFTAVTSLVVVSSILNILYIFFLQI